MRRSPLLMILALLLAGCATAPVTGRQQLLLLSEEDAAELGYQAYQDILRTKGVSSDPQLTEVVQRVGQRIARVSEEPDLDWQFNVINDPTPNAFALPGGYVGVHAGLFKVVENEDQLAAVVAHEIGHVDARHPSERLSRQALVESGLSIALGGQSASVIQLASAAATLGVILPFSRQQEAEADAIGLQYMAAAGYDPRAAIEVWKNMEAYGGPGGPEFLSTHPAPGNRIQNLQEMMPEALETYRRSRGG